MRYFTKTAAILVIMMLFAVECLGASYEIKDFGIKNIDVPEEYMSCSNVKCDPELEKLLSGNGFTFDAWKTNVMAPSNFYIYACNKTKLTDCMYLMCEKLDKPTSSKGNVSHTLAEDYNLMADGEERQSFVEDKKRTSNMENVTWTEPNGDTPYIEYYTALGEDFCHCFETVYGGNRITLMFSSKSPIGASAAKEHAQTLATLEFAEKADYTEVKSLIDEAVQKELEEETHSGENTKILRIIISVTMVVVIALAILMAMRSQSKKKRKTVVLREHEVTEESNETKEN